jgi:hypothetical protein
MLDVDMKLATAILLVLGLLGTPIGCLAQPCQIAAGSDDCCPRTAVLAACPFDILASAKAVPQHHSVAPHRVVDVPAPLAQLQQVLTVGVVSVAADQRNLHLRNRILLV